MTYKNMPSVRSISTLPISSLLRALLSGIFLLGLACFLVAAQPGGDLIVCDDIQDPLTLDPQKQFQEKNHTLVQQMYEGLVRFNAEGKIEPCLAVKWERIDPLTVRFSLRQGVFFHNGEPFTAEAVRFSIQRYLDPLTGFPALGFINSLDQARVVDDYTVDIVTKFPDGLLMNRLAGFVLIIPPLYMSASGDKILETAPVGTGPFKFSKWEKGRYIRLVANKDYWMKGFPREKSLTFKFIPSLEQFDNLISGNINILTELPGTRTLDVMSSGKAIVVKDFSYYAVVGSIAQRGPLKDKRVRQAINYAINREEIIRYDLRGNGTPLATVTMHGEEGHNRSLTPFPYDLKKARELILEAGYKDGFEMKVLAKEQGSRVAGIIKKQLEMINIVVKITKTVDATVIQDIASNKWDMFLAGCPDPMVHSFFIPSIFFYSKSPYSIVRDPVFDKMLEEMVMTLDPQERIKKAEAYDRYMYEQSVGMFVYQRIKTYGVTKGISFDPSRTGMSHFYSVERTVVDD